MIVTGVVVLTAVVAIINAAERVAPPLTVTEEGTAATAGLLLESVTVAPAEGAGASRVTVLEALEPVPPTTNVGDKFTSATPSGLTVRVAITLTPL